MTSIVTAMDEAVGTARKLSESYQASIDALVDHLNALKELALLLGFTDEPVEDNTDTPQTRKPIVGDTVRVLGKEHRFDGTEHLVGQEGTVQAIRVAYGGEATGGHYLVDFTDGYGGYALGYDDVELVQ